MELSQMLFSYCRINQTNPTSQTGLTSQTSLRNK